MIFDKPVFGLLIFLIIPAFLMLIKRLKGLNVLPKSFFKNSSRIKKRIITSFFFNALAWICLCIALTSPYFGQKQVSVQKTGMALSVLLDISHSMETKDFPVNNHSRLYASTEFAKTILKKLPENVPISVVIVKGEGQIAVPLTEDRRAVENFLKIASPQLISTPGSNPAGGILRAAESFPHSIGMSSTILFFTDAEELSGDLYNALLTTVKSGIKIIIVGMGDKNEKEIVTGDGGKAMSALREDALLEKIERVNNINRRSNIQPQVFYVNGGDSSALSRVFNLVLPQREIHDNATILDTEIQSIPRFRLFLFLALIFFILGMLFCQILPDFLGKISLITVIFLSCSSENHNRIQILSGILDYKTQNYNEATAEFLKGEELADLQENSVLKSVSGFNLATTYLVLNENDVAADKFDTIETTDFLNFPLEFNKGIVAHRKGDNISAARHFKNALKIDPSNVDAKINLEIVQSKIPMASSENQQQETQVSESSETSPMTEGIFSLIKEADGKRWQSQQKTSASNSPDY